jgi:hypothetical protein
MMYISSNGNVGRFIFNKRDLFQDGRPKPAAVGPEFYDQRYETSVCGLLNVPEPRLQFLGKTIRSDKFALGLIKIPVPAILFAGLSCQAEPTTFPEHGVILGWNADDKALRMNTQTQITSTVRAEDVLKFD